jgi:hypothetical protein
MSRNISHFHPWQELGSTSPGNHGAVSGVSVGEDLVGGGDELEQLSSLVVTVRGVVSKSIISEENVGVVQGLGDIRREKGHVSIDLNRVRNVGTESLHDWVIINMHNSEGFAKTRTSQIVCPSINDVLSLSVDVPHGLTRDEVPHIIGSLEALGNIPSDSTEKRDDVQVSSRLGSSVNSSLGVISHVSSHSSIEEERSLLIGIVRASKSDELVIGNRGPYVNWYSLHDG